MKIAKGASSSRVDRNEGRTTFHFVAEGVHVALERAREAAQGKDVRVGGGVETVRQYLSVGLIDELHLAFSNCLLGGGEPLLAASICSRSATMSRSALPPNGRCTSS